MTEPYKQYEPYSNDTPPFVRVSDNNRGQNFCRLAYDRQKRLNAAERRKTAVACEGIYDVLYEGIREPLMQILGSNKMEWI